MKNTFLKSFARQDSKLSAFRLIAIIAIVSAIGFLMTACDPDNGGGGSGGGNGNGNGNGACTTHTWGGWTITTPATCLVTGTGSRTCTACGTADSNTTIPIDTVNGHNWADDWEEKSAATCAAPKIEHRFCTRSCDAEDTRNIGGPLGHNFNHFVEITRQCTRDSCTHSQTSAPPVLASWNNIDNVASTFGPQRISNIAYGGGRFVATGDGRMAWSADGKTWTAVPTVDTTFTATTRIGSIAYGNDRFVVGSYNGRMAWSTDGQTWNTINNTQSTFGNINILGVTYGGDRFVAVGSSGRIAWSTNGETWTAINNTQSTFDTTDVNGVAYGDGRFVAVGSGGKMAWSTNGETWTAVTGGTGTGANPSDPGNSKFGAIAINNITYGAGRFLAVGGNGRMAWSTDGTTWTEVVHANWTIFGITYAAGKFVAVWDSGRMAWSEVVPVVE